jgi:hypothetical protein
VTLATAFLATAILLLGSPAQAAKSLPDDVVSALDAATKANAAHDVRREWSLLERAEGLDGSPTDAADAQRRLAVVDWKYHLRFEEARTRLLRAASDGAEPAEAWLALARMEQARGDFDAAREAARSGLDRAKTSDSRRRARLAEARASVAEAVQIRLEGGPAATPSLDAAFEALRQEVIREAGILEPADLLLRAALLLGRGDTALLAWRSYFRAAPGQPMPNLVADAGREIERLLPGWPGRSDTAGDRTALIEAMAGSRLFTEAALLALDPDADPAVREDPRVREVVAYGRFLKTVRGLTEEYYRKTALGEGSPARFEGDFKTECMSLVPELAGFTPDAPLSYQEFLARLDERFGAYVNLGETAGYFDLHMGHRVADETRVVEQYGAGTQVRLVVLDGMVSNGFESWAWESGAQHGGWTKPEAVYQVRPAYANGPLGDWWSLDAAEERRKHEKDRARESVLDAERAARDPAGYLPGLAMRLRHQGLQRLQEKLRGEGLEGEHLRLAFLAALERATLESSIFAHEGRHVLQQRKARNAGSGEFPAKLSEVAFALEPRLALGGIFHANIGDRTPHGRANQKIMKGLVSWMQMHADEVPKLDPDRPLLPQFDLLTDEQIRAAFRSMDPMAQGG